MCLTASDDLIPGPTKPVALVQSCSPTDCYKCVQACFCLLFKFCCHLSEDSRSHYLVFQSITLAKSLTCSATGRHSPGLDSIVLPCAGHDVVSVRSESRCLLHSVALGHQLRNVTPCFLATLALEPRSRALVSLLEFLRGSYPSFSTCTGQPTVWKSSGQLRARAACHLCYGHSRSLLAAGPHSLCHGLFSV